MISYIKKVYAHINEWIAVRANGIFASMSFFWFCNALVLLGVANPKTMPVVQFISSAWVQLVALPLIGVGTILAARSSDQLAKEQHDAVMKESDETQLILTEIIAIGKEAKALHLQTQELLKEVHEMHRLLNEQLSKTKPVVKKQVVK